MAVVTSSPARLTWSATGREAGVVSAYAIGAILLAGQAAVHVQQYFALYHEVRWIGSADDASYPTSVFGFMTLCHGQGADASATPRHFVRLDFTRS